MPGPGSMRLVRAALRCYPPDWRRRRGDEAAELARLLLRDGTPARAIAGSYLLGAARARVAKRERQVPGPRRRLRTALAALLIAAAALGGPLAVLASMTPANAVTVVRPHTCHEPFRPHC